MEQRRLSHTFFAVIVSLLLTAGGLPGVARAQLDTCSAASDCQGGVRFVAARYTGVETDVTITVVNAAVQTEIIGLFTDVNPGDIVYADASQTMSATLPDDIAFLITDGIVPLESPFLHVSCSQPLTPGQAIGTRLELLCFDSLDITADDVCALDCHGDLECSDQPEICNDTIDNNGDGDIDCADPQCLGFAGCPLPTCSTSGNCQGGVQGLSVSYDGPETNVDIYVTDAATQTQDLGTFAGVNPGDVLFIDAGGASLVPLPDNIAFVITQSAVPLEVVTLHVSCSEPLTPGQAVGDRLTLLCFDSVDLAADDVCAGDCQGQLLCLVPETSCRDCQDNDQDTLTDCADSDCTSTNACDPSLGLSPQCSTSGDCSGGVQFLAIRYLGPEAGVDIVVANAAVQTEELGVFTNVNPGDVLLIDATESGLTVLPDDIVFLITQGLTPLEAPILHVSCSQPIAPGQAIGVRLELLCFDSIGVGADNVCNYDCHGELLCVEQPEICDNAVDDNGNGDTDCDDEECVGSPGCPLPTCSSGSACAGGMTFLAVYYIGPETDVDVFITDVATGIQNLGTYTGVNPGDTLFATAEPGGLLPLPGDIVFVITQGGLPLEAPTFDTSCGTPVSPGQMIGLRLELLCFDSVGPSSDDVCVDSCDGRLLCADVSQEGGPYQCGDCTDNDGDLLVDCADPTICGGEPCDDGAFCTESDVCGGGACNGTPRDCTDAVGCTVDTCDETTASCLNTPDDFLCDDSLFCTGTETCDAVSDCVAGTAVDCSFFESDCASAACDESADVCELIPINEGMSCSDGDICTVGNTCGAGVCSSTETSCGNGAIEPVCGENCERVPGSEQCDTPVDEDGDGLIACEDPDCDVTLVPPPCGPDCQPSLACAPILRDPQVIRFGETRPDFFKIHGNVPIDLSRIDPVGDGLSILVTNSQGTVLFAALRPGDLAPRDDDEYVVHDRFIYRDDGAQYGLGLRDGIFRAAVKIAPYGGDYYYYFKIKIFTDLSAATESRMTTQIFGVGDVAILTANWKQKRRGWILRTKYLGSR